MTEKVNRDIIDATPTKTLFISILTRDISVRACIFDLIDNSVDAYIRYGLKDKREISINISKDKFEIKDNCGGIELSYLKNTVFRFGVESLKKDKPTMGIYGIGLKRAILKMGKKISLITDDGKTYSKVDFDIDEWIKNPSDWTIPFIHEKSKLSSQEKAYTHITVTDLFDSIKNKFGLIFFVNSIRDYIHITYTYFITNNIDFFVNNKEKILPFKIEARLDKEYNPAKVSGKINGVDYEIICYLDPIEGRMKKELGNRGWNVFCNKRLILSDNILSDTGWSGKKD